MIKRDDELYPFLKRKGFIKSNDLNLISAPYSIVVTSKYLERLGYSEQNERPGFINYRYKSGGEEYAVPIGIAAVVDQLPDKCDILCSERFYPELARYTTNHILDPKGMSKTF